MNKRRRYKAKRRRAQKRTGGYGWYCDEMAPFSVQDYDRVLAEGAKKLAAEIDRRLVVDTFA